MKKAKSLGLRNLLQQCDEAKLFFKKILALAYLPANLIERQFIVLKNSLSANLCRRLSPFCAYYVRYWLRIVRPEGFSVYGLGRRTNNVIESYHSRLGHRMNGSPVAWDFLGKLLKLAAAVKGDVRRLRNNCQISRHPRYLTIFKQNRLTKGQVEDIRPLERVDAELTDDDLSEMDILEPPARQQTPPLQIVDEAEVDDVRRVDRVEIEVVEGSDDDIPALGIIEHRPARHLTPPLRIIDEAEVDDVRPVEGVDIEVVEGSDDDIRVLNVGEYRPARHVTPPLRIIEGNGVRPVQEIDGEVFGERPPPVEVLNEVDLNIQQGERPRIGRDVEPMVPADLPRAEPLALTKSQKRNRRRNEMKRRARARVANENAVPGNANDELAQVTEELQRQIEIARAAEMEVERLRRSAEDQALCRICYGAVATHAFQPCGHRHVCGPCGARIWEEQVTRAANVDDYSPQCPFCRGMIIQAPQRIWLAFE